MDAFSYLSVLISVILGLAVTQILKGFRRILLSRARVSIYWPVIVWAALLLLICFQHWWSMFGLLDRARLDFPPNRHVFGERNFYMIAGLVFPDFFGEEVIDLKESYYPTAAGSSRSHSEPLSQVFAKWSFSMADCRPQ